MIDKSRIDNLIETLEASVQTRLKLLWNSYITIQSNLAREPSARHIKDLRVAEDALRAFLEEFGPKIEAESQFPAPEIAETPGVKLPPKQERFCQEYLKDLNATQAYIRAGYKADSKHVRKYASALMAKPDIQKRIVFLKADLAERTKVSQEVILANIMKIACLNPDRDDTSAKWSDVLQANVHAGKAIGMFQEGGKAMDPQELWRELKKFEEEAEATIGRPPKTAQEQSKASPGGGYGGEVESPHVAEQEKPRMLN